MLGIYSPHGSMFEVYFTPDDAKNLLEKSVQGEFFVRVENSRARVLEARLLSSEESGEKDAVKAILNLQSDPHLLQVMRRFIEVLTSYNILQHSLDGGISLFLRISDEAQIAGFRASVDIEKPKSSLILPLGY